MAFFTITERHNDSKDFKRTYIVGKKLGQGCYSIVKKVTLKKDQNKSFAAKIVTKKSLCDKGKARLEDEIKILQELDHPHIIQLHQVIEGCAHYYLITELMTGGELFDRIASKTITYSEQDVRLIMKLLFEAIDYCHERGIVHRDLKPENILLVDRVEDRNIKIADFGFAKKVASEDSLLTKCGTPMYVAPEILNGIPYGRKVDLWSLGVIGYILLVGRFPFTAIHDDELQYQIKKGLYQTKGQHWNEISSGAKGMVSSLLTVQPGNRLSAKQALLFPWMLNSHQALSSHDLCKNLVEFKRLNVKRKLRAAVFSVLATNKFNAALDENIAIDKPCVDLERSMEEA